MPRQHVRAVERRQSWQAQRLERHRVVLVAWLGQHFAANTQGQHDSMRGEGTTGATYCATSSSKKRAVRTNPPNLLSCWLYWWLVSRGVCANVGTNDLLLLFVHQVRKSAAIHVMSIAQLGVAITHNRPPTGPVRARHERTDNIERYVEQTIYMWNKL